MSEAKCDICEETTDFDEDVLIFGDWILGENFRGHYFCLLLSTDLKKNGREDGAMRGFKLRDIRKEIPLIRERICCYCNKPSAPIACHHCKKYFHLGCGHLYDARFHFVDDFRSYCHICAPMDEHQKAAKKKRIISNMCCYICKDAMDSLYNAERWIHAKCCGNGYVHRYCMRKYALKAGYYLSCLWCGSKSFRDQIRTQSVYVPDRDAEWELEKGAYADLHPCRKQCGLETCLCPYGRQYASGSWRITLCSLCGTFGAHNPGCLGGGKRKNEFICNTCGAVEPQLQQINGDSSRTTEVPLPAEEQKSYLVVNNFYKFDKQLNCIGCCKLRIDLKDPKCVGKSLDEIVNSIDQLDSVEEYDFTNDKGFFGVIDEVLESFTKDNSLK